MDPLNIIEYKELISKNEMIAVLLGAADCNVCNVIKPKLEDMLESEYPLMKFVYIDLSDKKELAAELNIFTIPVFICYFGGNEFIRKVRNFSVSEVACELERPYTIYNE